MERLSVIAGTSTAPCIGIASPAGSISEGRTGRRGDPLGYRYAKRAVIARDAILASLFAGILFGSETLPR